METPTKNSNVLSQSNRRQSQFFQYRQNGSYDDPCSSSTSQHGTSLFHTDSGYTSESLSFDSPESYHGLHRSSAGASHLEPIIEGVELHCLSSTAELTPTTRNLKQLSAFHITTPASPASPANKRPSTASLQSVDSASATKSRRLGTINNHQNATPRKGTMLQRQQSFMDKLDHLENIENQPNSTFHPDRMDFSPIVGHRGTLLERKPSEHTLQSSTPIDANWSSRFKGNTGQKVVPAASRRLIRKTQSFSPSKHFLSKYDMAAPTTSSSIVLGLPSPKPQPPASPLVSGSHFNPARKLLDFNEGTFESLVKPPSESRPTLSRQTPVSVEPELEMSFVTPTKQRLAATPTTPTTNSNSMFSIKSNHSVDIMFNSAIIIESPSIDPICHQPLLQTPKKLTRSFSLTSPKREQHEILYAHLPCTPPKSVSKRKRLATSKLVSRSLKRKLYDNKPKICMAGMNKVDIVGRLEGVCPAIDRICKELSTIDLANFRQVSWRWCRILESNKRAINRVVRKARRQEVSKENLNCITSTASVTPVDSVCHKSRIPFSRCNTIAVEVSEPQTPVGSPRTRAFQDSQKLIKTLTKTQRLMKCPRCAGSSIIDRVGSQPSHLSDSMSTAAPQQTTYTPRLAAITKHQSCPIPFQTPKTTNLDWSVMGNSIAEDDSGMFGMSVDDESFLMSGTATKLAASRSLKLPPKVVTNMEYGRCTNKVCGFVFCVNCWGDVHGDRKCLRTVGKASSRERTPYVAGSKQSKNNLRRLGSLEP